MVKECQVNRGVIIRPPHAEPFPTGGDEGLAIGAECVVIDRIVVPLERGDFVPGSRVPERNQTIASSRSQAASVRGKSKVVEHARPGCDLQ